MPHARRHWVAWDTSTGELGENVGFFYACPHQIAAIEITCARKSQSSPLRGCVHCDPTADDDMRIAGDVFYCHGTFALP